MKKMINNLPFVLFLLLIILIPFQAFLITWARELFNLSNLGVFLLSSWKEYIIIILIFLAGIRFFEKKKITFELNLLDKVIVAFFLLVFIYFIFFGDEFTQKVAGVRYDLELFVFYLLARYFVFTKKEASFLVKSFLVSSFFVIVFGLLQIFTLSPSFMQFFGYSSGLSEYNLTGVLPTYELLSPALQGVYRIQSFLPGALQFSSYLILVGFIALGALIYINKYRKYTSILLFVVVVALTFTFTRSAWIGSAIGMFAVLLLVIKNKYFVIVPYLLFPVSLYLLFKKFSENLKFQAIFLHGMIRDNELFGSTLGHLNSMKEGFALILSSPLGLGLGVAGPASRYAEESIIPENWYLQIGGELGLLGLLIFVSILVVSAVYLFRILKGTKDLFYKALAIGLFGTLIAISVSSLFLHTWADTATVYPFWIFVGLLISQQENFVIIKENKKEN